MWSGDAQLIWDFTKTVLVPIWGAAIVGVGWWLPSGGQYRKLQFSIGIGVVDSTAASAIESFGDKLQLVVERAHWDSSEGGIGTCTQLG